MRSGGKGFIYAGVALGLVAVLLVVMALAGGGADDAADQAAVDESTVTYVYATRPIPAHTVLAATDLEVKTVPADEAPLGAVTSPLTAVGMAYRTALTLDQPVLTDQLEQPGLSNDVAVGMRAFSLPVDERSSFAGLVATNDYIDVVFKARVNLLRLLPSTGGITPEDAPTYEYDSGSLTFLPPDIDTPQHPATGDTGSQIFIRDDIGDNQQLEPVAKVMLQDIRVLRVIRPGQTFSEDGQPVEGAVVEGQLAADGLTGSLVLEVTLEQAEVLTFMQDTHHQYQVVVRGREDHEVVSTDGISFQLLATTADYALPLPGSLTVGAPMLTTTEPTRGQDADEDVPAPPSTSTEGVTAGDDPPASPEADT